jgi:outer membrane receptor protein involved in Fe transport
MKKSLLTIAISAALLSSLTSYAAEEVKEEIERIEVTGSKIKRADLEGVAPLSIITAAEIEASGLSTIADVLQSSVANAGASFGDDVSNSFTVGASSVNLRGMGANRTLVLINGRRQAAFPTASGGTDNFVDVSDIPTSAVERVEILTGGASAIYGSDAIGGVVNIILKDNYEGSKLSVKFENPEAGGRDVLKLSFTKGFETEKSNTVLMFEYTDSEELLMSDRQAYFQGGLNRIYNTDGFVPSDNFLDPDTGEQLAWTEDWGWGGAYPSSWGANIVDYSKVHHDDKYPVTPEQCNNLMGDNAVWYTESSYKCRYDKYPDRGLSSDTQRANLIVNSEYELSAEWTLFGMLNISSKDNDSFKDKKGDTEYFYQNEETGEYTIAKPDADYDRFQLRRRYEEFSGSGGSRHYVSEDQKYSFAAGASGSIGEYDLEVAWSTGYNRYSVDYNDQIRATGIESIITFDPNDADTSKWYPLDKMTPEQVEIISGISTKRSSSRIHQFTSTLTGELMELPAGDLSFATSFEWAQESYKDIIDQTTQTGGFLGRGGTGGEGSRDRYAGALELLVPLLRDVKGVENLELSLAGRYDYYDDKTEVGGAFSPQVGIMYHPTEDILIRGSWGKSFRAPDMHRVYAGTTIGFGDTEYELPDGSIYEDSYRSISSGSLTLEEEEGEYASIGLVANITENFDMTLDWWSIELEGAVRTISTSDIYAGPNDFNPAYDYTGQYADCIALPGPGFMLDTDDDGFENLDCIKKAPFNSAMEKSEGIDVEFVYKVDTKYGDIKAKLSASYLKVKEVQDKVSLPVENYVDTYFYPTWKSNASLSWSKDNFSSTLSYYYTGTATGEDLFEYTDTDGTEYEEYRTDKLDAYGRLNWSASIKFDDMGRLKLGIKNITNEMPPLYDIRNGDSLSSPFYRTSRGYSTVGRTFYIGYDFSF